MFHSSFYWSFDSFCCQFIKCIYIQIKKVKKTLLTARVVSDGFFRFLLYMNRFRCSAAKYMNDVISAAKRDDLVLKRSVNMYGWWLDILCV